MAVIGHLLDIASPPERVYRAITEQAGLASWWTRDATAVPEVGSIAEFKFGARYHNKMRVSDLQPDLRVEWECLEGDREWVGTKFVFDLEPAGGSTILRFGHTGWREETDFFATCNFNWGYYLHSLKDYCERGKGTPFSNK